MRSLPNFDYTTFKKLELKQYLLDIETDDEDFLLFLSVSLQIINCRQFLSFLSLFVHKLFQRLPTNPRDTNDHLQLNVSEHMVECFGRCVPTMPDSTVDTIGYLL